MNSREALKLGIDGGELVSLGYLEDLTDAELLHRPHPAANHIKWQLGHLIAGETFHMNVISPGSMPPLPEGFAAKYSSETALSDSPSDFHSKAELLALFRLQRAGTLAVLAKLSDEDLDRQVEGPLAAYFPTVASLIALQGTHWVMHAGQWAIVRRQLGKPPLF